jgi:hypothetical protein
LAERILTQVRCPTIHLEDQKNRPHIDKRLDKCRDFLFVIYISINIVYCILHCGSSDYFDDYYFRFLQFTKNSVG